MARIVDVNAFGANPNDAADDTAAIDRAVNALAAGDTLRFGRGTYLYTPSVVAERGDPSDPGDDRYAGITIDDSRVTVAGAGRDGGTVIELDPDFGFGVSGLLRLNPARALEGVAIRDLAVDGSGVDERVVGVFVGAAKNSSSFHSNVVLERVRVEDVAANGFNVQERTRELVLSDSVAQDTGSGYTGSGTEVFSGFVVDFARDAVLTDNFARGGGGFGFNVVTNPNDVALLGNVAFGNGQGGVIVQGGSGGANVGVPAEDKATHDILVLANDLSAQGSGALRIGNTGPTLRATTDVVAGDNGVPASAVRVGPNSSDVASTGFDYLGSLTSLKTKVGTSGADTLNGTSAPDLLHGFGGNDTLSGRDRADVLAGGAGRDTVRGGAGNDAALGGDDADRVFGEGGNDAVAGGSGNDTVDGGGGNDLVIGGLGADTVLGQSGNDDLIGGSGLDVLIGGTGNDRLRGGSAADRLTGGDGADRFDYDRANEGAGAEAITDFRDGTDAIDIADLLTGFAAGEELDYVRASASGGNTLVSVDRDGASGAETWQGLVVLQSTSVSTAELIDSVVFTGG